MKRHFLVVAAVIGLCAPPAFAQQPLAVVPATPQFLSRYDFHLSAAALANTDPRFSWDTHFGGDVDVLDYVRGRTSAILDYEALLGNEFRPFDPNQGNYQLELSTSYRLKQFEVAGMFNHVSRHLSDRSKEFPIAWNILGVRALKQTKFREYVIDLVGDVGGTTQRVHVDYEWAANATVSLRRQLNNRLGVFTRGEGHFMGVSPEFGRGTQSGGEVEGGVRLVGSDGVAEFFVGYESRFDAYQLDFEQENWFMVGFRCTSAVNSHMVVSPKRPAVALLCVGLIAVCSLSPSAANRPPKLDYQLLNLPNGLTVVLSEDHSTPIVHVQLWYHVGSKNERPGRTGFAHLFEHLMFKGSKNVAPEGHTSMISGRGGQSNAYTTDDETVFWETLPASDLPLALWLEADRMATLKIDRETFANERAVVKEERRLRVDNQPFGRLNEIIYDQAFSVHPYKHPTIGSMEDLEAASVEDVRDFYNTYYVPANATLAVVGDFDTAEATALITQYFGRVPKSEREVPRDIPQEPAQSGEKRVTLEQPWPLPAVVVAYHITRDGHPDSYPLHIAAKVLSDGQSSRIYKELVYDKQLAVAAFGEANLIEDPNLFYAVAIVQPGQKPETAAAALIAELDRLKDEPITEHELERTKNQFARDYILSRESNQQKAQQLAHALVIHKDVRTADGEFEIFQNITTADVQRVARTYFRPENRLVLTVMPSGRGAR